ncbi:MAG: DUF1269 domain-containing protein, partial [Actinomycetota bacterium]
FLHDAAVVERGPDGKVEISERTKQHGAAFGAMVGGAVGLLVVVLPPVGLAAVAGGAAVGGAAGAAGSHIGRGLSEHDVKELGSFLAKGEVALLAITDKESEATVLDAMGAAHETVSTTSKVSRESLEQVVEEARQAEQAAPDS